MAFTSWPNRCQYQASDPTATAVAAVPASVSARGDTVASEAASEVLELDARYQEYLVSSLNLLPTWERKGNISQSLFAPLCLGRYGPVA